MLLQRDSKSFTSFLIVIEGSVTYKKAFIYNNYLERALFCDFHLICNNDNKNVTVSISLKEVTGKESYTLFR